MGRGKTVVVLRGLLALLIGGLGVAALVDGRVVVGVLLLAMAVVSALLTVTMHRRRKEIEARFNRFAERRAAFRQGRPGAGPGARFNRGVGGWAPGAGPGTTASPD